MPNHKPNSPLETTFSTILTQRRSRSLLRRLTKVPPGTVDFSSNDYLSLSTNPEIRTAFLYLLRGGPSPPESQHECLQHVPPPQQMGSRGSRLLDGNHSFAESLEALIAAHHGSPSALLFNSGFEANVGLLSCVPQPEDIIVYDELIHASVHDGTRLSRVPATRRLAFTHNSVTGLRAVLQGLLVCDRGTKVREGKANVFIAVEAVYSMDGDVAPLKEMLDAVEDILPRGNGYVIVDEAHATGLFGHGGSGLCCELGVQDRVFARVVTFGKALGSQGAVVLCSLITRDYLINYARTLIYTTAMSFPSLASIKASYDFMLAGRTGPLLRQLHTFIYLSHRLLMALASDLPGTHLEPPLLRLKALGDKPSPIIPIFTPYPRSLAAHCQARGFMVRPIVAPTVPHGQERVRLCLHSANTVSEVEGLVRVVGEWVDARMKEHHTGEQEQTKLSGGGTKTGRLPERGGDQAGTLILEKSNL